MSDFSDYKIWQAVSNRIRRNQWGFVSAVVPRTKPKRTKAQAKALKRLKAKLRRRIDVQGTHEPLAHAA